MGEIRTYIRDGRGAAAEAALEELRAVYERGWEPLDVLHATRKKNGVTDAPAAARLVLYEARLSGAHRRAPADWVSQLNGIAHTYGETDDVLRMDSRALWAHAAAWRLLGRWEPIVPTPSQWHDVASSPSERTGPSPRAGVDAKMLARIRGLLAKAESTEFDDEAQTLTAKAHELMTRYSVSTALLEDAPPRGGSWICTRRFRIDNPYVSEKVGLLMSIAGANRVRMVHYSDVAIVHAHGSGIDLEQVDLLFTSLLVQATRAMQQAAEGGAASRTTSFRKGFLVGYAQRIRERLTESETRATATVADDLDVPMTDLLPALASRRDELDAEMKRLYPRLRRTRSKQVDRSAYEVGRSAADRASLRPQQRIPR